jgi:hypothetical protein
MAVEVDHPQVHTAAVLHPGGWVPMITCMCWEMGGCTVDDVAQHLQLGHHEGTLAEVDGEAIGG